MAYWRELASLISLILLLSCRRVSSLFVQYVQRMRTQRRRLQVQLLRSTEIILFFTREMRRRQTEGRARRSVWSLPRPQLWFERLLNERSLDHWWKENFRVSRDTFDYICRLVGPVMTRQDTTMRRAIPIEKRVSASLWRLATGECYRSCGLMMGLSKPTVIKCCHEFVRELCRLQGDFIKFPTTRQDIAKKIEGFSTKSKIPNVMAAIDGTHIKIKAPQRNHEDYFNRKHYYSYVMQGVVDSSGLYLSVSTGYPGSMHDARVLRLSELFDAAENQNILMEPTMDLNGTVIRPLIVGDSAYPLKTWLLRPFKDNGALTQEQKKFNKELSKARIISEHAYGMTKGRWRVLEKRLDEDTERIPDTIIACCVLHNICILRGEDYDVSDDSEDDDDGNDDPTQAANETLAAIVDYVSNQ